jgi:stress response protein SCP2
MIFTSNSWFRLGCSRKKKWFFRKTIWWKQEEEYDLDAIAFLLDSNGLVANLGEFAIFKWQ